MNLDVKPSRMRSRQFAGAGTERFGALGLQALFAAIILGVACYVTLTTLQTLSVRGITTGFGFLFREAGFDVAFTLIPFSSTSPIWKAFFVGVVNTSFLSALAIALGTMIGLGVTFLLVSRSPVARKLAAAYVGIFRNTPLLLHLLFWYFAVFTQLPPVRSSLEIPGYAMLSSRGLYLPKPAIGWQVWLVATIAAIGLPLLSSLVRRRRPTSILARPLVAFMAGLAVALVTVFAGATEWEVPRRVGLSITGGIAIIPELAASVVALSLYASAFIADVLRGAIASVDRGQTEAGVALGLSRSVIAWQIVLPQAVRIAIPPLTNQFVNTIKQTAIVAAIAFPDLMNIFGKTVLTLTGQAIEVLTLCASVYLAISLVCAWFMHRYAARLKSQGVAR